MKSGDAGGDSFGLSAEREQRRNGGGPNGGKLLKV